jgi:hypothetical protein
VPVVATAGGTSSGSGTPVLRRPREGIRGGVAVAIVWPYYEAAFTMRTYVRASDDDLERGKQASPGTVPVRWTFRRAVPACIVR